MPDAIDKAARIGEIGFPEFTAKLVTDVFDALVAANIRQTEAYIELVNDVANGLSAYINKTRDDIGGEEILQFLALVVPPADASGDSEEPTKIKSGGTISGEESTKLQKALEIQGDTSNDNVVPKDQEDPVAIDDTLYNKILEAVANRIAANKYTLLEEMVKLGILRLVVENGVIETRLTFSSYEYSFAKSKSTAYNRKNFAFRAKARTSGLTSLFMKASASTSYNSLAISTAEKVNQDRSGSRVSVFGRVQINFKTDYLPLNQ